MSDYPDHLNPFKRSTGIRESFRSLKKSIQVRFRKKDISKDRASTTHSGTILRPAEQKANGANGVQMPRSETIIGAAGTPEMLPRSRFNERVPRAKTLDFRSGRNPFDDDDNTDSKCAQIEDIAVVQVNGKIHGTNGTDTARRRRRKKRAPLPPGATSMLAVPSNSEWSINSCTSYETDYSTSGYIHSENEDGHPDYVERLKDIQEISKEIQGFCDNGVLDVGKVDDVEASLQEEQRVPEEVPQEDSHGKSSLVGEDEVDVDGNTAEKTQVSLELFTDAIEEEEVKINRAISSEPEKAESLDIRRVSEDTTQVDQLVLDQSQIEVPNDEINNNIQDKPSSELPSCNASSCKLKSEGTPLSQSSQVETAINDCDTSSNTLENSPVDITIDEVDSNTAKIAYVDRKSIYIDGSTDNLLNMTQINETCLYITDSTDQLDSAEIPTPKVRKHKLGREHLLGSNDDGSEKSSEKQ